MITRLTKADFTQAAAILNVPLAVVQAVAEVESQGQSFLADGKAVILFERHIFYKQLKQYRLDVVQLAQDYPQLVNVSPGGYQGGKGEYERLNAAQQIHEVAAYNATSWGAFQVMGLHWQALGYTSIHDFVERMQRNEQEQLDAFIRYVKYRPALIHALQTQQWAQFAKGYNGTGYVRHAYDLKLAQAWTKYARMTA